LNNNKNRAYEISKDEKKRQIAHKLHIIDIENQHYWLVTLLVVNAVAMETLPIFLHKLMSQWLAIGFSVIAVLFVGEIIPQAYFSSSNAMEKASKWYWFVRGLMYLTWPVSYPISVLLIRFLGHNAFVFPVFFSFFGIPLVFFTCRRVQMKVSDLQEMIQTLGKRDVLTKDQVTIMGFFVLFSFCHTFGVSYCTGAVTNLHKWTVEKCMMPMTDLFAVSSDMILDRDNITQIWFNGKSRIPVYEYDETNIVGVLLIRDLCTLNPDDEEPVKVKDILTKQLVVVEPTLSLEDCINVFQAEHCHFAMVTEDTEDVKQAWENNLSIPLNVRWLGFVTLEVCVLFPSNDEMKPQQQRM
jgi:metal transporter CNNM